MTETILFSIGGLSLATVLTVFNGWLDRRSGKFTRQALARRLALRLMAWDAGETARKRAKAEAMERKVELV